MQSAVSPTSVGWLSVAQICGADAKLVVQMAREVDGQWHRQLCLSQSSACRLTALAIFHMPCLYSQIEVVDLQVEVWDVRDQGATPQTG